MVCNTVLEKYYQIFKNVRSGRFFIPALFVLASTNCFSKENLDQHCVSTHFDEKAVIDYVIDGDTVVLKDKRHIRLIGINTPELSRNNKPAEAGAIIARDALKQILAHSSLIHLVYGHERHDRHGRTLAHIHLTDGTNVQAKLLKSGLAMPLRIPPNLSLADCYNETSQLAKNQRQGLWALPRYKLHAVNGLSGKEKGFYFISGKVTRVTKSRSSVWINLENNIALRVKNVDLSYFNNAELLSLAGKTIEANGWLYKHKGQLRMQLRHKLDLNIVKTKH